MFFIKKIVFLICIAAVLLSGCSGNGMSSIPEFSFSKDSSQSALDSGGISGGTSSDIPTGETSDISEPVSGTETSLPVESVDISDPNSGSAQTQKLILSYDPINEKSIEIGGGTLTVTGRTSDSPIVGISASERGISAELNPYSGGFTAKIKLDDYSIDNITITFKYDDGCSDEIGFKITPDGFVLPDLSEIEEANRSIVGKALEQPQNQVAEYIVKGGDPDEIRKILGEIQRISDEICTGLKDDYDKLRAISRWVSANIYYDYPAYDRGVPDETLSLKYMLDKRSSVCGGYSNMTSALCAAQGIKCWNVHGSVLTGGRSFAFSNDGEYHEWNFAEIGGRIIWVDSGWNSYCYLRRNGVYDNGGIGYRYFDISGEYLAVNHKASYAEYRDYFSLVQ